MTEKSSGPLAGVKILDMTTVLLGPYATQILGDLGAEVIKVETAAGDRLRWTAKSRKQKGMSPLFLTVNRNKKSILLDLKDAKMRAQMDGLIEWADVFITNVRGAGLERLGLDYEGVKAVKADSIYVHCVGYGKGGAYAGRQAYDDLVQAASGIADLEPKTRGTTDPALVPSLMADKTTGLHAVYATLAALFHKERTGEGQFVEVPMLECMVNFNLAEHFYSRQYVEQQEDDHFGYSRVMTPNRRPFKTADGFLAILPYADDDWPKFFELAGREDLWAQYAGADHAERTRQIDALYAAVGEAAVAHTTDEWLEMLDKANIAAMRVNRLEDLMEDPHLTSVNYFEQRTHPTEGDIWSMRHPVHFSATPADIRSEAPTLGGDTEDILAALDL